MITSIISIILTRQFFVKVIWLNTMLTVFTGFLVKDLQQSAVPNYSFNTEEQKQRYLGHLLILMKKPKQLRSRLSATLTRQVMDNLVLPHFWGRTPRVLFFLGPPRWNCKNKLKLTDSLADASTACVAPEWCRILGELIGKHKECWEADGEHRSLSAPSLSRQLGGWKEAAGEPRLRRLLLLK